MTDKRTIVLVLRSGGDFSIEDVQLISRHINGKWISSLRPRIVCLWDRATSNYSFDGFEVMPLKSTQPGTWARIELYSPKLEHLRPFLYVDLDTAVINSLEKLIDIIPDKEKFITLEDFWQKGQLATGLVWFPANSEKVKKVYDSFSGSSGFRMDSYLRKIISADLYWQNFTDTIYDFKPRNKIYLNSIPENANLICFHGKPRIRQVQGIKWVDSYINQQIFSKRPVSVIIPYNKDRGWLQDAINSVPKEVQLILSKGDGNWCDNFNEGYRQAEGDYIKWLHEDDMLTENCIEDSVNAIESQNVDFIHGNAIELRQSTGDTWIYRPKIKHPTYKDIIQKNVIHQVTLMYRKRVFEEIGLMDDLLNTMEEFEYHLRVLRGGMKIGYCDSLLGIYRRHPEQKVVVYSKLYRKEVKNRVISKYV